MLSTNWIGGNDPETYSDPYAAGVKSDIYSLQNSDLGAQAAQQSERAIGQRYAARDQEIQNDSSFGRNAAVSGKLHDMALSEVGGETANANVKGAEQDQSAKREAGEMGLQAGQLGLEVNKENYQREQSQTFGNSFVGGLLKSAIGYGAGALEGKALNSVLGNSNNGSSSSGPSGNSSPMPNWASAFTQGASQFRGSNGIRDNDNGRVADPLNSMQEEL